MKRNTLLLVAAAVLSLAVLTVVIVFGAWRYSEYRHASAPLQGALLRDRSDSNLGGCDGLAAMAKEVLDTTNFQAGSSIAVMATGDDMSAGEPVLLDTIEVPVTTKVIEGRAKNLEQRKALIEQVRSRCRESGQTERSPIYMGIRRAVEYLRAKGCDGRSSCVLYVQSDLEELSERGIRELINTPAPTKKVGGVEQIPARIDNSGINVRICGLAETSGSKAAPGGGRRPLTPPRDARRADRVLEIWSQVFTDQQRVSFNPLCPKL